MQIDLTTNTTRVSASLRYLFRDQVPFAASKAINDTLKQAQAAERRLMARRFTIRRRTFAERSVKIKPFATKRSLSARIQIEPPGGKEKADIWVRHEERGRRVPIQGHSLAVPIEVRKSKRAVVRKDRRPRAFRFQKVATRSGGVEVYKGIKRTFMIQRPDGTGYIIQRRGKRRRSTRLLYRLVPSVPLQARLGFIDTMNRVTRKHFPENFRKAFRQAIRTAR